MYSVEQVFNHEGKQIDLITIKNKNNMEIKLLNFGATLVELAVPDKKGMSENVVLTHENVESYLKNPSYFGVTVGRTSGRIAKGTFQLDGREYHLNKNYGVNHGHGGPTGFTFQIWNYEIKEQAHKTMVEFDYMSKDMEENYPGNLKVIVTYILTDDNHLVIEYRANTDQKTLCNLTNHSYFNLSGHQKRKVTEQALIVKADYFLELNEHSIPTGKRIDVENTPMDFRKSKLIGKDIESEYEQLRITNGYDHTWLLKEEKQQIEMVDEISGRKMSITTTYPGVVIYSYNFPNNEKLKRGTIGSMNDGICFETQFEPDGIHHGHFHSAILNPQEDYYERTEYAFSTI